MRIVLVAQEAAGVAALRLAASGPHDVCAVLTGTDSGEGAERGVTVASVARELGVPLLPARRVKEPAFGEELRRRQVDVLLNVHSLYLVAAEVLAAPRIGSFNLHPGPLPAYAGLNVPSWALYRGERRHGVTLHWMAPRVDAGPIVSTESFDVGPADTALSVSVTCVRLGIPLIAELLDQLDRDPDAVPTIEQDLGERRWFGRNVPHDGWVPWTLPAGRVADFVRACDYGPWPSPWGAPRTVASGTEVAVLRVAPTGRRADLPPGTVGASVGAAALVATGDEWLRVTRTQIDGISTPPRDCLRPGVQLASAPSARNAPASTSESTVNQLSTSARSIPGQDAAGRRPHVVRP